jgi:phospholipid-binding lipoprotein MlaA
LLLLAFVTLSSSLLAQEPAGTPARKDALDAPPAGASDPLERVNRAVFGFNSGLTRFVFKPVSRGYEFVVPKPVRRGLDNIFDNVRFPVRFAGSLLQGKFQRATRETGKFAVNTVAGVGGLFKISDRIPAPAHQPAEDMGQTLAVWRLPSGPYLVLPVLGPSTPRELLGRAGDSALTPTNWDQLKSGDDEWLTSDERAAIQAVEFVNALPTVVRISDEMKAASLDPYVATREAYLAHRAEEAGR